MTKIDSLITAFTNHFHTIITVIFGVIILYIVKYPYYLEYYFENTLGRASLIFFIIAMTYCNPMLGALATVAFIGLYNSRVIEGMEPKIEIIATSEKKPEPKPTDAATAATSPTTVSPTADPQKSDPTLKPSEPAPVPKLEDKKKESFHNMASTPADLNEGRNRMLTVEDYMRIPKFSNQMSFSKYYETSVEPMANYSGPEGMQSTVSLAK
jgi:hypothetical protein